MQLLGLASLLISITALFSFINTKWLKLPTVIGVMLIALVFSLGLILIDTVGWYPTAHMAKAILSNIDFNVTLLHGMLSFLLFAGALHVNLEDLAEQKWVILTLATFGVMLSTVLVAGLSYFAFSMLGIEMPFIYYLLFGALISPTDPIAVMSTLKSVGAPRALETKIAGESLFNDGIGVVIFLVLLGVAVNPEGATASHIATLFAEEALGGIAFGLALGAVGFYLLRSVDNYQTEILISLAIVMGGYSLATQIHVSGPISMVVAGLFIGNHGRHFAMSEKTRDHLDTFWELIDEILNALLFVLIGLEILVLQFTQSWFIAGIVAIAIVLLARTIAVGLPIMLFQLKRTFNIHATRILVWGGLRGGISVALALSLPEGEPRNIILAVTYIVVVFSIIVQGLTIKPLVQRAKNLEALSLKSRIPR
ncbi:MAG: CPA1 family monovalent cation:H+ antiporter [Saprospiraceae bacterium]|jgi:CPA1 family monovalent cation:H+ antiporter